MKRRLNILPLKIGNSPGSPGMPYSLRGIPGLSRSATWRTPRRAGCMLYAVFYILYSVFLCHRKSFMKFSLTILIIPAVFLMLTACNNHSAARVTDAKADSILRTAAIFPFTDSIKQFPDSPRYYFARGSLLYSIRQYGLSKLDLEKAIGLNPREPAYYYGLGEVNMAAGKPSLARNNFEQALALNPKNVQVRLELASALFQLGNYP